MGRRAPNNLGMGTIINLGDTSWFGRGTDDSDLPPPQPDGGASVPAPAVVERPPGKLTRNQRRKLSKQRYQARIEKKALQQSQKPKLAATKPTLTEAHQAQIDKLRQLIRSGEATIAATQAQLDRDRLELNELLLFLGLPPEP